MPLTELAVRSLKPPGKGSKVHSDDAVPGFGIRVSQGGVKAFGWCPRSWCSRRGRAALSGWFGRVHHAAGVGSMIAGSSPSGAMVSRLM